MKGMMILTLPLIEYKKNIVIWRLLLPYLLFIYPVITAVGWYVFYFENIFHISGILLIVHCIAILVVFSIDRYRKIGEIHFTNDHIEIKNKKLHKLKSVKNIEFQISGYEGKYSGYSFFGYFSESMDGTSNVIKIVTNENEVYCLQVFIQSNSVLNHLNNLFAEYSSKGLNVIVRNVKYK